MLVQDWFFDVLLKATLILTVAVIADRVIVQSSAATRHRLWSMALLMLLMLPILCATVPQWRLAVLPRGWSDSISQSQVVDESRDETSRGDQRSYSSRFGTLASASNDPTREPNKNIVNTPAAITPTANSDRRAEGVLSTKSATSVRRSVGWLLLAGWVVGALLTIAPLLRGVLALAVLRRSATGVSDAESVDLLSELCSCLGISRRVVILRSERSIIPMTWGVLRPIVIVPQAWTEWGTENRRIVLLHELAHVKRFDSAYQTVGRVACSLYWFHPLAWYALRRLRIERELACDNCVLMSGESPNNYAKRLLEIARQFQSPDLPPAVAMTQRNGLEFRVRALLDQTRLRSPVSSRISQTLLVTSLGIVAMLATVRLDAAPQIPNQDSTTRLSKQGKPPAANERLSDQLGDTERAELSEGQFAKNLDIRVVDSNGNAIAGAKVIPWALRSYQGHGHWLPDQYDHTEMISETATSGLDGIATIKYPFYRDTYEQVRTTGVSIVVRHPEFVMTESIEIDVPPQSADAFEVKLETGVTLELLPMIDGEPIGADNLFVRWSDSRSVRRYNRDLEIETTEQGTLRLPPMRAGANSVMIAKIENDRATYLSEVTNVELVSAEDKMIEISLTKATPIEGKLSDNVPRPVREGRVVLQTLQSAGDHDRHVQWHTWVPVREDGSFTINAWPPGETIRALAICDGFHSNANELPHELTDSDAPKRLAAIRAHLFRKGEPVEIDMVPMAKWLVTVLDENHDPVVGVDVKASPWAGYAASYARSEMHLQGRDDQYSYPHRFQQKTDKQGKLTMQLPAGRIHFTVTSDVYEMPSLLGSRDVRVESNWGQSDEVSIQLQPKGTEKLGEWDKLGPLEKYLLELWHDSIVPFWKQVGE